MLVNQETVNSLMEYNEVTGKAFWKVRGCGLFNSSRIWACWNSRYAEKEIGCVDKDTGYIKFAIGNKTYYLHQIIWILRFGHKPKFIDHIDHNKTNNRLVNLREVERVGNATNMPKRQDNTSGRVGVWRQRKKWVGEICIGGITTKSIPFLSYAEACEWRSMMERSLSFHENHGNAAYQ